MYVRKRMKIYQPKDDITIEDGFKEFLKYCKVQNYAKATIDNYLRAIKRFGNFYNLENLISSIDINIINSYILEMREEDLAEQSVATNVKCLKTIFRYFMEREWLKEIKIKMPKFEKQIKETYTDAELARLLKKPNVNKCGFTDFRNWVLVNYFIATGQRLNTVINIKIEDLDLENELIKLTTTKSKRQMIVPLTPSIVNILQEYLRIRNGGLDDYLFCSCYGQQLTSDGAKNIIVKYNNKRGVTKTSIHMFRHTFAKKYLLAGGDIFRLQRLLMHKDIKSTKEYLEFSTEDLKIDYDRFNPLEQCLLQSKNFIKNDKTKK